MRYVCFHQVKLGHLTCSKELLVLWHHKTYDVNFLKTST